MFVINYKVLLIDDLLVNKNVVEYKIVEFCFICMVNNLLDSIVGICMWILMGIILFEKFIWWYVDFGEVYSVYNIRI